MTRYDVVHRKDYPPNGCYVVVDRYQGERKTHRLEYWERLGGRVEMVGYDHEGVPLVELEIHEVFAEWLMENQL